MYGRTHEWIMNIIIYCYAQRITPTWTISSPGDGNTVRADKSWPAGSCTVVVNEVHAQLELTLNLEQHGGGDPPKTFGSAKKQLSFSICGVCFRDPHGHRNPQMFLSPNEMASANTHSRPSTPVDAQPPRKHRSCSLRNTCV